ncbi:MAG: SHOCT domain-containing protein [Bacilli bacterium]|nr:SHOCT domain-containing protein [Bacilli bacterium]
MNKEFVFKVSLEGKAIIKLNDNSITISRPGFISKFTHGFVGEKTILINQITSVQFKKSNTFTRGFLQFIVPGTAEAKKNSYDENIVYFKDAWGNFDEENKNAEFIKKYIEEYNMRQNELKQVVNSSSNFDEIKKLKELLDINAITQEEFEAKKKELLNLKSIK